MGYFRGYSNTDLHIFNERLNLNATNRSHNRSDIRRVLYSEIEKVIIFTPEETIDYQTGELSGLSSPIVLEPQIPIPLQEI